MTRILHQTGHMYQWNVEIFENYNVGDGLILSPRYINREKLEELSTYVRSNSLFDPQYFVPGVARGKLESYEFHPQNLLPEYDTAGFSGEKAHESAEQCVEFQRDQGFAGVVVPSVYRDVSADSFIEYQSDVIIAPFLEEVRRQGVTVPVYLQLVLPPTIIRDEIERDKILDWVSTYEDVDGIYIIFDMPRRRKQLDDADLLWSLMYVTQGLSDAGFSVIVGYLNTESLLLLPVGIDAITMGSYENLRDFRIAAFDEGAATSARSPRARVYISSLLQWVDFDYLGAFRRAGFELLDESSYSPEFFEPTQNWHFQNPILYKHYFEVFCRQVGQICDYDDCAEELKDRVDRALALYNEIEEQGIELDEESSGYHLLRWKTAINEFKRERDDGR